MKKARIPPRASSFGYQVFVIAFIAVVALIGWSDYRASIEEGLLSPTPTPTPFGVSVPFECGENKVFKARAFCPGANNRGGPGDLVVFADGPMKCSSSKQRALEDDCSRYLQEQQDILAPQIEEKMHEMAACGKATCEYSLSRRVQSVVCPSSSDQCPLQSDPCSKSFDPNPIVCPSPKVSVSFKGLIVETDSQTLFPGPEDTCTYKCVVDLVSGLGPWGSVSVGCDDCLPH